MKTFSHGVQHYQADVVIVGSGIAGAFTAYKLVEKGIKVLILEAGPRIKRDEIVQNFMKLNGHTFSGGYPNVPWAPRPEWGLKEDDYIEQIGPVKTKSEYLRVVGGTTWHWNATVPRMIPTDFKMASTYQVARDWPIDYNVLEPFYAKAEIEMGVAGDSEKNMGHLRSSSFPLPPIPASYSDKMIMEKLKPMGIEFVPQPAARNSIPYAERSQCMGFGTCSPICPSAAQYSASVHIEKAEKLGVRLIENARVDRLISKKNGMIEAVEGKRSDNTTFTASGKIVILAANGIETPQTLIDEQQRTIFKRVSESFRPSRTRII